ncbi:MAG: holo-ACP synthase [Anaerolineae bacterium]|nr:holo-ACP synthase [Anaerolineae bacterium]MDW8103139.1 holo-ACP synthase [Anaerolineae bacterium]
MQAFLVGVDLVELERVEKACQRWGERFKARVFTPDELKLCGGYIHCLAARFAAKEAVAKALGTGIGPIGWKEVEILRDESGRPCLKLSGKALARATELGVKGWNISLAHSRTTAIAFVIGWKG